MRYNKNILYAIILLVLVACKKEEPIDFLADRTGGFVAELRTGLSNRNPQVTDTVVLTATTWHRDDDIRKVEFTHTLFEEFGLVFELNTTKFTTNDPDDTRLIVTDTIRSKQAWFTTDTVKGGLNSFYNTEANAYVVFSSFTDFDLESANFPIEGDELIDKLSNVDFRLLTGQLSQVLTVAEYLSFFPAAPDEHFTFTGANKTGLTEAGRSNLRANLTKSLLKTTGYKSIRKKGSLSAILYAVVTTGTGAVTELSNTIKANYQ